MKKKIDTVTETSNVDSQRRQLLKAAGAGMLAATFSGVAFAGSQQVADKQSGSVTRTRKLLNTSVEALRQRLEAERENFVSQVQTQQTHEGIELFLRRQKNG